MMIDPAKIDMLPFDRLALLNDRDGRHNHFKNHNETRVITGFNTDIEHEGVIYHVQTEDKGLDSPLILSLVYTGGAILAAKRSPYEDLIEAGFDEVVLTERLKRQHRLICAAIKAGRVEELKRMSGAVTSRLVTPPAAQAIVDEVVQNMDGNSVATEQPSIEVDPEETILAARPADSASETVPASVPPEAPTYPTPELEEGLRVTLLEEREFYAGESLSLRVVVSHKSTRDEKPLPGIPVSVKILGTTFRPIIVSVKTQKHGLALIDVDVPRFTSGRAAILVRAVRGGESVEIRRVVHPAS